MSADEIPPEIQARIDAAVATAVAIALQEGRDRRNAILEHDAALGRPMLSAHLAFMSDVPFADAVAALSASPLESERRGDIGNAPHPGMEPAR